MATPPGSVEIYCLKCKAKTGSRDVSATAIMYESARSGMVRASDFDFFHQIKERLIAPALAGWCAVDGRWPAAP